MTIQGYQFDKAKVTPEADAMLYSYIAQGLDNKVISGSEVTASGLNIYVSEGKALVQGRLVAITQQHNLTAKANESGYVCITVDLTQDNTATGTPGKSDYLPVNNQLRIELVRMLNQQDLSNGGLVYTFPLFSYTSTSSSVSVTRIATSYPGNKNWPYGSNGLISDAAVRKVGDVVFLQINTTPTSNGNIVIGTLPQGYRPSIDMFFPIGAWSTDFSRNRNLAVYASGQVYIMNAQASQLYKTQISFLT